MQMTITVALVWLNMLDDVKAEALHLIAYVRCEINSVRSVEVEKTWHIWQCNSHVE